MLDAVVSSILSTSDVLVVFVRQREAWRRLDRWYFVCENIHQVGLLGFFGENVLFDNLWETGKLERILVRFLVDVEVDVGVTGVVCSEFWPYGSVEAGVCGTVTVSIGGVAIAGVGQGIGRLPPEEDVAMEDENCSGDGKVGHSVQ